jgi:hypothetical protein
MTEDRYLHVEVRGGEIMVTLLGSNYKVICYKSTEPWLTAKARYGNTVISRQ